MCAGRGSGRVKHVSHRLGLERAGPQPLQLAGRAGQHNDGRPPLLRTKPGAVPARPIEVAPSGSVACLRTPCAKSAYGRPRRSAYDAGDGLDLRLQALVDDEPTPAARATISTVRSSCVGPSPPDTTQRSAASPSRSAASRSSRIVSDDRDPRGVEPEREHGVREKRAVTVSRGRRGRARCRWRRSPHAAARQASRL